MTTLLTSDLSNVTDTSAVASASEAAPESAAKSLMLGGVHGAPRVLLRLEGAVVLAASLVAYAHLGGSLLAFALLFLAPDLSMLGFLAGPRIGAVAYNAGHSHLLPASLAALALALGSQTVLLGAVIWIAHIGFDRFAGYGLKYGSHFFDTHLGRVGRGGKRGGGAAH